MGYFVYALFTLTVVVDILYAYYGWVRLPPLQSLFVRRWLAAMAVLFPMGIAAIVSGRMGLPFTVAALMGLLLLAGPLLTPWQERRPVVMAMNILSSLTSFVTIFLGLSDYAFSDLFRTIHYLGVIRGLAVSVPFVILSPICMWHR